jgi:hypothetical protein
MHDRQQLCDLGEGIMKALWMTRSGFVAVFAAGLIASTAFGGAPRVHHPILGAWIVSLPGSPCLESDTYDSDGRSRSTSAQEISVSEYSISSEPDEKGFYKMVDVIVEANGLPDCVGSVTPVGDSSTVYLRFNDKNNQFLLCTQESMDSCFVRAERAPTI